MIVQFYTFNIVLLLTAGIFAVWGFVFLLLIILVYNSASMSIIKVGADYS